MKLLDHIKMTLYTIKNHYISRPEINYRELVEFAIARTGYDIEVVEDIFLAEEDFMRYKGIIKD